MRKLCVKVKVVFGDATEAELCSCVTKHLINRYCGQWQVLQLQQLIRYVCGLVNMSLVTCVTLPIQKHFDIHQIRGNIQAAAKQ